VSATQFSYASYEVAAIPLEEGKKLLLDMPRVTGYTYVGFGLWTYKEGDMKWAFGYESRPTMFPMGDISLIKR
jgi:hypothetical protein